MQIYTERLFLRPVRPTDATRLAKLVGARVIAITVITRLHPMPIELAVPWVSAHEPDRFGICEAVSLDLIAAAELRDVDDERSEAEPSFWIGQP